MAANKAPQAIRAAKQALRKKVRTKLRALDEVTVREESEAVTDRLLFSPYYTQANRLSVFMSMATGELKTDEIVRDALQSGKAVFIPYTNTSQEGVMKMLRLKNEDEFSALEPNTWGIREHKSDDGREEALGDDGLDLMLMPGIAFDRTRTRLGYGKGYYDRYVALIEEWTAARDKKMPALVALALSAQIQKEEIPFDSTDYKPDLILTPDEQITGTSK